MNNTTLSVYIEEETIFKSDRHWLIPLFELETFVKTNQIDLSKAVLHDKIIGKAAAFLILRLGVQIIHANIISRLACEVFDRYSIQYTYDQLVERISCKTEEMLANIDDPEIAYDIIYDLANRRT